MESGPVEQVLEHPSDPYTVSLLADVPTLAVGAASPSASLPVQPQLAGDDHPLHL